MKGEIDMKDIYQMQTDELYSHIGATEKGLTSDEARDRKEKYGDNVLE